MKIIQYRGATPNFGDDLNKELWPALAPELFGSDPKEGFVGIGTIIGIKTAPIRKLHVFSSGAGNDAVHNWHDLEVMYWCVRGPISARLADLATDTVLTDGAILTPFAPGFPTESSAGVATLVMPHFQSLEFSGWREAAQLAGFELVDPRGDLHELISKISRARLVLTESLHGAILADTYGIPWSAFATSGNFGSTKFLDWCLSLDLPFNLTYVPPPNPGMILKHGKGPAVWGNVVEFSIDDAIGAFNRRIAPPSPPTARSLAKNLLRKNTLLRRMLPYSPARTAAALARLSASRVQLSNPMTRHRLQDRMMARLAELRAYHHGSPRTGGVGIGIGLPTV